MAYEIPGFSFSLPAGADLSGSQFRFVDVNSSAEAVVPTASGARVIGVRQNKPKTGEAATIVGSGISYVELGGTVAVGANVQSDAAGKAITAVATKIIAGIALEGGDSGAFVAVLLRPAAAVAA